MALPEQDRSGVEQALQHGRISLRAVSLKARGAAGGRHLGAVDIVLDGQRHAVQRAERLTALTLGIGAPGCAAHRVWIEVNESVERRGVRAPL